MTAKEKAIELVGKYEHHSKPMEYGINFSGDIDHAIECALICVDEIINTGVNQDYIKQDEYMLSLVEFYTEVKEEINKL